MRKLIPVLILVVLLSGCSQSKSEYLSDLSGLRDLIRDLYQQILDDVKILTKDPLLWENKDKVQVGITDCESLVSASNLIGKLKPPKELKRFHEKAIEWGNEMKESAEEIKLYFQTRDSEHFRKGSEHLQEAELKLAELSKEWIESQR